MLANGGEEPTLFLWAADKHPYPHPFRVPTTRPMEKGDLIICEMHPKFGGYFTHVERTFCLGEPEHKHLDIYDGCLAAYRRGLEVFRPRQDHLDRHGRGERRDRSPAASASARPASTATASPRWNIRATATTPSRPTRGAQGDRRPFRARHGVRDEHRPVRSEMAQRQDRLRVRRDDRHHRHGARRMHSFPMDFQKIPV